MSEHDLTPSTASPACLASTGDEIIVRVKQGLVRGFAESTPKGFDFKGFLGIPYGKPAMGKLRFKAPQPANPWEGIFDATKEGDRCYHHDVLSDLIGGTENCLNLNVYTPQLPQHQDVTVLRPVMVWIHGGGFVSGSNCRSVYGPEYLIQKDIVLVVINYRLGVLGFLSFDDPSLGIPGNAGLKDQVLALHWVKDNIVNFGGDAKNITIFGESAGAASVGLHMVSPMSRGLFHKAILQSGAPNCLWAQGTPTASQELLRMMNRTYVSDEDTLSALQSLTVEQLIQYQLMIPDPWKPSIPRFFAPIVEKYSEYEPAFLPDEPFRIIERNEYHIVPIMMGVTSQEGMLMSMVESKMNVDFNPTSDEEFIPFTFKAIKGSDFSLDAGKKIREYYYGTEIPVAENKLCLIEYMSDVYFNRPCIEFIEKLLVREHAPIFAYMFCLDTNLNVFKRLNNVTQDGVCHAEDLFYLFKNDIVGEILDGSIEELSIRRMVRWWTNFAKYADPNGPVKDPLIPVIWPEASYSNVRYLEIKKTLVRQNDFLSKVSEFWRRLENLV